MSGSTDGPLPAWAHTLGANGLAQFMTIVRRYFAEHHIAADFDLEEGLVRPESGVAGRSSVLGLQNIAQACSQVETSRWTELITAHFDCIFAVSDDQNALTVDVADFERVKDRLRARLYPVELLNQSVETVHRPGPDGTLEVIVLDLPTTVRTISRSEARAWPLDRDMLFDLGRRNLRRVGKLTASAITVRPGVEVRLLTGDPYYAGSHALILDAYLPASVPHGALVGMPRRDMLLMHIIRNIGTSEVIGSMLQAIISMYAEGPGSLSPNLYWYRHGEFVVLPYELVDNVLNFMPPADFAALLHKLAESAELS